MIFNIIFDRRKEIAIKFFMESFLKLYFWLLVFSLYFCIFFTRKYTYAYSRHLKTSHFKISYIFNIDVTFLKYMLLLFVKFFEYRGASLFKNEVFLIVKHVDDVLENQ